jgi:hypothetical protein
MDQLDDLNLEPASSFKAPSPFQFAFDKMIKDMRFVGMFSIIYGAITCLTIIGALVGVPTIIIGLRMREAADQFAIFKMTNEATALRTGFELQGRYFNIIKILIIVSIVLFVLYLIFIVVFFSYIFSSLGSSSLQS